MKAEIWNGDKIIKIIDCDSIRGSDSLDASKGNYCYFEGHIVAFLPENLTVFLIKTE